MFRVAPYLMLVLGIFQHLIILMMAALIQPPVIMMPKQMLMIIVALTHRLGIKMQMVIIWVILIQLKVPVISLLVM